MGWPGHTRHLVEVLPSRRSIPDIEGLRAALVRLNFTTEAVSIGPDQVEHLHLPCLVDTEEKEVLVLLARTDEG